MNGNNWEIFKCIFVNNGIKTVYELLHLFPHQRRFYPQLKIKLFAITISKPFDYNLEFLKRHHENAGEVKKAIHFFTRAGAYNNVIRICKEHGLEDQLLNVALLSNPRKGAMHVSLQWNENFILMIRKFKKSLIYGL